MLKCHVLLVIQEKMLVLVPPKLSSELELRSTFLGQFWRHSDGIFSRITRRTVAFCPMIVQLIWRSLQTVSKLSVPAFSF